MEWSSARRGRRLEVDWSTLPELPIDPYLVWADLSDFQGIADARGRSEGAELLLRVALELDPDTSYPAQLQGARTIATAKGSLYVTASVDGRQLQALLCDPAVRRLEIGFTGVAPPPTLRSGAARSAAPDPLAGPVMAVIDYGCAFAHERFRSWTGTAWRARIRYLWDQGLEPAADGAGPWRRPIGQGYGRELSGAAIEGLIAAAGGAIAIDDDALYRAAGFDSAARVLTHGTHVLDLAAGAAPDADPPPPDIIFVQLPRYAVDDTSGGSMVTHVLDALAYIGERTRPDQPLVINLSYGSMAGPHDGSTLIEAAMDAFIAQRRAAAPRRKGDAAGLLSTQLVLPAGNSFELEGHASWVLTASRPSQQLSWQVLADDTTDSFLEIWYPRSAAGRIELCVTPPLGPTCCVPIEGLAVLRDAPEALPMAAVIHRTRVASGLNDAMALVALAPTAVAAGPRKPAPSGLWRLELRFLERAEGGGPVPCDALIERDDPSIGSSAPPRQSRFVDEMAPPGRNEPSPPGAVVRRDGTGNSIANGALSLVVGACMAHRHALVPSRYSSAGPPTGAPGRRARGARKRWPDLVAPADESDLLPGIRAAGTRSGTTVRMNGTSVAAPQVARIALEMACQGKTWPPGGPELGDPACPRLGEGRPPPL